MTTERPSDELTGMVVAEKEGWDKAFFEQNDYPDDDAFVPDPEWYMDEKYKGCDYPGIPDPRDDTDEALRLLGWVREALEETHGDKYGCMFGCNGWFIYLKKPFPENWSVHIPLSGEAMRYAVVNLAIKVMGLSDEPIDPRRENLHPSHYMHPDSDEEKSQSP